MPAVGEHTPAVDPTAWVALGAIVVGDVRLGPRVSVWFGAVLRGDLDAITIGEESNIQDGCVVHTDPGFPVLVGRGVSVGHRAVLHGCTVEDGCLIGMGAVLLNGSVIGAGSIVGAGTVVREGARIPPRSLVLGVPERVRRDTTEAERAHIRDNAATYLRLASEHAAAG